jgi:pimeloyl-ACP methyl ester carboxylesterase
VSHRSTPSSPFLATRRWTSIGAIALPLWLAACGGGGSKDPDAVSTQPVVTPPVVAVTGSGELKGATHINTIAVGDIADALKSGESKAPPVATRYAVDSWRITYLTTDGQGKQVTASGLVSVPVKPAGVASPVVSYQHGTIFKDAEAPSNNVVASEPPLIMASLGAIVLAPDYVGYGASKGTQHPYLLSAPSAAAVIDLLTAAKTWRQKMALADNGQLFLVGYSEGGYVTMAAHRALQAGSSTHKAQIVGSVPGAGPYHVGVTMDALLDRVRNENKVLGALINPGFLSHLGSTVRDEVRRQLMKALIPDDADVGFQSTFIDNFLADDTGAIERDSNVHDWKPEVPVRMYHGRDDQTVPYAAATTTLQAMQRRGAQDVTLTDCTAVPSSHLGCVPPYFSFLLQQVALVARNL